ncbi:caspase family protein [Peristeroidobacter soli]|uniref:caspase family protein n=1 Tax=Peristeroidobacter soli TaxID=2497877 RepID=UPI0013007CD8|nr:caspase family protein [Peristeroidobacter soli]
MYQERCKRFGIHGAHLILGAFATLLAAGCSSDAQTQNNKAANITSVAATGGGANEWCTLDAPAQVSADGIVRLGLIVGVGTFQNKDIKPLLAPAEDARTLADLITAPTGYGFPKSNVCVLTDRQATRPAFVSSFQRALSDRAKAIGGKHPVQVLVFFSGHGSYTVDHSKDEPDGKDELLILHDSWAGGVSPLRDDEFNGMIAGLHRQTQDIVVILDSCHSGSATKGLSTEDVVEKMTPPQSGVVSGDDNGPELDSLPGVVRLAAARDGTAALAPKNGGRSYFTVALEDVLAKVESQPLSWEQVARRMRIQLSEATLGRQLPVFQGDLTKLVFSDQDRARPYGWVVDTIQGENLNLRGVPLPGWSLNAELRIYAGNVDRGDVSDPQAAKASAKIMDFHGITAKAKVVEPPKSEIKPGDIAVLSIRGEDSLRLPVTIATTGKYKLSPKSAAEITALINSPEYSDFMTLSDKSGAFIVESAGSGQFAIRGPEGVVRISKLGPAPGMVPHRLKSFARQQILLSMEGEPGMSMRNNDTLRVRLVRLPPAERDECPYRERALQQWVEQCPNQEHLIPVCSQWRVEVANTGSRSLRIGGAVLFNDGATLGLPVDGDNLVLPPDGTFHPLDPGGIESKPPLNVPEYVVVFGTDQTLDIDWGLLQDPVTLRKGGEHPLAKTMRGLLGEGIAKSGNYYANTGTTPWTSTTLPYRVLTNPQFEARDAAARSCPTPDDKEYTLAAFDIDPYLPAADNPLHKVLSSGYQLANRAFANGALDGVPYRQHGWSKGSGKALPADDAANLKEGIDCSRAIWYAFTRSGAPYTSRKWHGGYLSTAEMFDAEAGSCSTSTPKKSLMHENFDSCMGEDLRTGDVLVYQGPHPDTGKCVGHTVMVVDPEQFVGWGSHGWDGSTDDEGKRLNDTGVEYQKILQARWNRWDRTQYKLKACWRHRQFVEKNQTVAIAKEQAR